MRTIGFLLSLFLLLVFGAILIFLPGRAPNAEAAKKPHDWFMMQRVYPGRQYDYQAIKRAREQVKQLRSAGTRLSAQWQLVGPSNIGGRITALAASQANSNILWAGAADGGVWKSVNGGQEWFPVFDEIAVPSIGAIAVSPASPEVIYVGTGEANASGDSYPGNGVYRTTNGGATWEHLGLENTGYIGRIAINPVNPDEIFVAATGKLFGKNNQRGIYKSADGGLSWQKVLFVSDSTAAIDVAINPANPQYVYAAMWERIRRPNERKVGGFTSGIYASSDGGQNWYKLGIANGLPNSTATTGRIGLAIAPSSPQRMYAVYADHPGYFAGVYRSDDGGYNWLRTNDSALSYVFSSFGWYFGQIYCDPTSENTVYVLGVDLYRTTDGGNNWQQIGWNMHVDHHAIWIDPNNNQKIVVGNDGGIYTSNSGVSNFQKVLNLPITQFYAATVDQQNIQRHFGGTQDNGTLRTLTGNPSDWNQIYGGDGFYVIVDHLDPNIIYAEYQYGGLGKSTNGGYSFVPATNGIQNQDRRNWMVPVVMDPNDHNRLYYGTYRIYVTTDGANYWQPVSPDLSNGPYTGGLNFGTITTIAVAPSNSDYIYAGTDDGNIWISKDQGANWQKIDDSLPDRWVTHLEVDPQNEEKVLVSFSGYKYDHYSGYVFQSGDAGLTWHDITFNLPACPVNDVLIEPLAPGRYFAATDFGVFFKLPEENQWYPAGEGLPASVVMDLVYRVADQTLVAATHGRSMWELNLAGLTDLSGEQNFLNDAQLSLRAYPNPFNQSVKLAFRLAPHATGYLEIYNVLGKKVFGQKLPASGGKEQEFTWHGQAENGRSLPSGVYLVRIKSGGRSIQHRIVLMK
ncbi:MAG: exo-alpha-sialidase [Calditrichia bacterium]